MLKPALKSAQDAIDQKVKEAREAKKQDERKAKEDRDQLLARARQRPMLVESYNTGTYRANNLAKAKALKQFVQVMKDAGLTDKQIEDNHLSLDDKEALAEEKFVELQKKRYQKDVGNAK